MTDNTRSYPSRRDLLGGLAAGAAGLALPRLDALAQTRLLTRKIPKTGEALPAIGMGSWITFNVGAVQSLRDQRVKVLKAFFEHGGGMVDSSPMYGSSEEVIGYCLEKIGNDEKLFSATKVWTIGRERGQEQMEQSERLWGEKRFDLLQIHNLLDWDKHMKTLTRWKEQGRVRYIGMTTSHGRRHDDLEEVMKTQPLDFVQFTYNIADRAVEKRLLPLAADKGLGVIINRPFRRGGLVDRLQGEKLPGWAADYGIASWPQFLLKFIVSHPAVTCAIPATSRVDHMSENMRALEGEQPDARMRQEMIRYVEAL